ncbi:MAG: L-threonylcarbamoyladenylate synthase [Bacteroidales bacterium]|nr:L-threonylcarbamoyladenylate synthase [Bacteroidales bacterium]
MLNDVQLNEITGVLRKGGTILYPTDTIWGIGCDATNTKAVDKVFRIKERLLYKSLIVLVKDVEMLEKYVSSVPDIARELISSFNEPLTIIYPGGRHLPKNVIADDGSVAVRIPDHSLCLQLLDAVQKPLTSTSANITGAPIPYSYRSVSNQIKEAVDYIVPLEHDKVTRPKPSTIIKIDSNGELKVLRN